MNAASAAFRVNARGMADATAGVGLSGAPVASAAARMGAAVKTATDKPARRMRNAASRRLSFVCMEYPPAIAPTRKFLSAKKRVGFGGSARQPALISRIRDRFLGLRSPVKTGIAGPGGQNRMAPDLHREAGNPTLRAIREAIRARGGRRAAGRARGAYSSPGESRSLRRLLSLASPMPPKNTSSMAQTGSSGTDCALLTVEAEAVAGFVSSASGGGGKSPRSCTGWDAFGICWMSGEAGAV